MTDLEKIAQAIVDEFHPFSDGRATTMLGNLERSIATALAEERERCAKIVSDLSTSQRALAKGNYSHEHHSAYMLGEAAAAIRSETP